MSDGIADKFRKLKKIGKAALAAAYSPDDDARLMPFNIFLKIDVEAVDKATVEKAVEKLRGEAAQWSPLLAGFLGAGEKMRVLGIEAELGESEQGVAP